MTGNPFNVVFAKPEDQEAIFVHLMRLASENRLYPVNEDKVREEIRRRVTPNDHGMMQNLIGLIRGPGGRIEASIGLSLSDIWYSDVVQLQETWVFVEGPYRATPHAKNLVAFAKWYADTLNAALKSADPEAPTIHLSIGILTLKSLEPKKRLYQRMNLQQIGATFMYPAPDNAEEFYNERRPTPKAREKVAA